MNKHERITGILALGLLGITLLWCLLPGKQSLFSARVLPTPTPRARLNINEAGAEALEELPDIGPVLAENILCHRQEKGPVTGPEDLLDVTGIGEATLAKIEPYITY